MSTPVTEECGVSRLTPEALSLMANFLKTLSEVSRLQIICCLKTGSKNVSEIIEATQLGQANVSKHLKILNQAGLVSREQRGVCVYYHIANPLLFELCDLVCSAIAIQVDQQREQLEQIASLKQNF